MFALMKIEQIFLEIELDNPVENAHVEARKTELLIYKRPVVNSSTTVTGKRCFDIRRAFHVSVDIQRPF